MLTFMKQLSIVSIIAAIWLAGCSQESATAPPKAAASSSTRSVALPAMTALTQGDTSTAVTNFLSADWSLRPVFPGDSPLSLTEDQFKALARAQQEQKSQELTGEVKPIKQLAQAVAGAGREAAAKGDTAQARKIFTSLKEFGAALAEPGSLELLQLVGKGIVKMADTEVANLR
jgi:hypothetical protein